MDRRRMVSSSSSVVKVGPWGSRDKGAPWDDGGGYTGIRSIIIRHGLWGIGSITVEYDLCGQPVPAQRRGGIQDIKDFETERIVLDPDELLTGVEVFYYGMDRAVITSMSLTTSRQGKHGPYPRPYGERFSFSADEGAGAIVGFCGTVSNWYLRSIGLYVATLCPAGEFYDKMQKQGVAAYRTSPLGMPRPSHSTTDMFILDTSLQTVPLDLSEL